MSTIEKLTIQGIRSFGTKSEDVQTIHFASPVTLILGENGCGKTTIIECLKYVLTGEAPPGSNRGQNFIHDPKIFDFSESLGQIKLLVKNIRQERISVCRSMKISYKRGGKPTFETLDATMNYMANDSDKADSISKRCVDVDVAMSQFMGVSKAILNNVIFCHQEDSSWPLDEAKKLKEKFDAIFGITEYNKAVEKVIKMRKEQIDDLKVKETNLKYLSHLKIEMEDKAMSLQKAQEKSDNIKELCTQCDADIKPIDERLLEIRKIEYEVGKFQALKAKLETKQQNCIDQITNLNKKIKKPFEGSIDELDVELQTFDAKMSEKKIERREKEEKLAGLKSQEKKLQQALNNLDKKSSSLIQQRQKEQECNADRADKIKMICDQMNVELKKDVENNPEDIADVLEDIQNALLAEQCQITETLAEHDQKDQQRQTEIDQLRVDITKLEEGIAALKKQKVQQEKEFNNIVKKLSDIEVSSSRLKEVTAKIEQITKYFDECSANLKQDEIKQSISDGKTKVATLQDQFHKLDERLTFLNSISKLTAEIDLKEKEKEKKEQEVKRVKSKHSDNLKQILEDKPVDSNFKRTVHVAYEGFRRQIKELNKKESQLKLKEQSLEIKRKNLKDDLVRLEKELADAKDKIYEKCHSTPYEDLLNKCKDTVAKLQLEHGALRSAEAMYKRYIKKVEDDPSCPLCHKGMSGDEVSDLTTELTDEIDRLPENISATQKLLKAEQKKYENFLQLKPVLEKVSRLETDIPLRKEEMKKIEEELTECTNNVESLQLLLAEPTTKLELSNSMLGDMSLLDEALKELTRLEADVTKLKKKLPENADSNASIDDLQLEKTTVSAELENERSGLEKLQNDYEKGVEALNKLREKRNKLKDEQLSLQEGVQSLPQLRERRDELTKLIENNTLEMSNSQVQIQPQKLKLKLSINEKAKLKEADRKKVAELQRKHDSHKKIENEIERLGKEIIAYKKLDLTAEIDRLKEQYKSGQDDLTEKNKEVTAMSETLDEIKNDCAQQETLERDLKDNRELKVLQQKKVELDEEHTKLSKQIGELDFQTVSKEKNELVTKRDEATVRKGEMLGQIGEINAQIKKLTREVNDPKYKDSVQNYRRSHYEVEITKRMIADLGQYRISLEWALMQFHKEKMEKINRLIREYWRQIYRGNDIDYIQIQTDDGSKLETSADRKRNYNYRVIQSKNNQEIEMRGRCSAGQRVLASLIIRMALAETFSSNCGVLALDEPTTNLDHVNILSLCEALNRIVDERQAQSNFMLIIITHDEEFISTLGKINTFYRVFRNDDGKSVIRKVKVT